MRLPTLRIIPFMVGIIFFTMSCTTTPVAKTNNRCEGIGPLYDLGGDVEHSQVGAYRPILLTRKAMLVLANKDKDKIVGILSRTIDKSHGKGEEKETFLLDMRSHRIRLIESPMVNATDSSAKTNFSVQIFNKDKQRYEVKEFDQLSDSVKKDVSFSLAIWDSAKLQAADFFRGCLASRSGEFKSLNIGGGGSGGLGVGCMVVYNNTYTCPPGDYMSCIDCSIDFQDWNDWLNNFDDSLGMDWESSDSGDWEPPIADTPCRKRSSVAGRGRSCGLASKKADAKCEPFNPPRKEGEGCCRLSPCKTMNDGGKKYRVKGFLFRR
jgi:hypothetical protein